MTADSPYRTPAAFRAAVDAKLKALARRERELRRLDAALTYVGACLNPILDGTLSAGRWNPRTLSRDPESGLTPRT